jgi:hypothetical protein
MASEQPPAPALPARLQVASDDDDGGLQQGADGASAKRRKLDPSSATLSGSGRTIASNWRNLDLYTMDATGKSDASKAGKTGAKGTGKTAAQAAVAAANATWIRDGDGWRFPARPSEHGPAAMGKSDASKASKTGVKGMGKSDDASSGSEDPASTPVKALRHAHNARTNNDDLQGWLGKVGELVRTCPDFDLPQGWLGKVRDVARIIDEANSSSTSTMGKVRDVAIVVARIIEGKGDNSEGKGDDSEGKRDSDCKKKFKRSSWSASSDEASWYQSLLVPKPVVDIF